MSDKESTNTIELLTFGLGGQEYSLDIMAVREIRGWAKTTPMPHAPSYMRGVINLRGTVLPVIDLAERLGLPAQDATDRNVIIVVNYQDNLTGLLVDAVSDILAITENDLQSPPEMATTPAESVVRALTLVEERMIRVLDISSIVETPESAVA